MSTAKNFSLKRIVIDLPNVINDETMNQFQSELQSVQLGNQIVLNFSQTKKVEKSFFLSVYNLRKQIEQNGGVLVSEHMSLAVKNLFIDAGVIGFLNHVIADDKLLDVKFVQPFIDSTINVLKVQANVDARMQSPVLKKANEEFPGIDIAGVISIVSDSFVGTIAICFSEATFLKICSQIFGEEQKEITSEIVDSAGEILNMIFGGAKAELNKTKKYGIQTALPTIVRGKSLGLSQSVGPTMVLPFETSAGPLHIEIEIVSKGGKNV